MDQTSKANRLVDLHAQDTPLVLYTAWDAGSGVLLNDGLRDRGLLESLSESRPRILK